MRPLLAGAGGSDRASGHPSCNRCTDAVAALGRHDAVCKSLEPARAGLIAAALSLVADQGIKLFMLYGAHFTDMPPGQPCRCCRFLTW